MSDELAEAVEINGQLSGGFYKRAWQIINQDKDAYLDDLKRAEKL